MRWRWKVLTRVLGCTVLAFVLGATFAWGNAAEVGRQGEAIVGIPWPRTAGELSFLLIALSFAIGAGVWVARTILAIRQSPATPPSGHAPVNGTVRDVTRSLTLIEEQHRTIQDLSTLTTELHRGMGELTAQVKRVADHLERERKAG